MRRVIVQNEKFLPLKGIDVEMYRLAGGTLIKTVKTDANGIASFPEEEAGTYWFRPKTGRGAGKTGEQSNFGAIHFSEMPIV